MTNEQLQALLADTFGDKVRVAPDVTIRKGQWFDEIVDTLLDCEITKTANCMLLVSLAVYDSLTDIEHMKLRCSFGYFVTDMRMQGYMFMVKEVYNGKSI